MFTIALNTIREFIRNKILYIIILVAILLILFSLVLSTLALSEEQKIILDFSLTVIELFWLLTTLFLGSYLLYSEISKNTILMILSKAPNRWKFLLWKFFGFMFILLLVYICLSIAFWLVVFLHWIWFEVSYFQAIFLSFIKILVVLAFILFFSTFASPFVSLLVSMWIYIISHSLSFVKFYLIETERVLEGSLSYFLINVFYYVFPNFHDLSMKEYLISPHLDNYTLLHIIFTTWVHLIYIAIILIFAVLIFRKRQF